MGKLHELLAVEKSKTNASNKLLSDTLNKFGKSEYFKASNRVLKMLSDSAENEALELAAFENSSLPTTVKETLDYALKFWSDAEDITFQKNVTNQKAVADITVDGVVLATNVPVDELLGLESRLETLRKVADAIPTLSASVSCVNADTELGRDGSWVAREKEVTTKTEKIMTAVVLYEATDKHPAQVKEVAQDKVVGKFTKTNYYGSATSAQKADMISRIDELLVATKQARMRANSVEADNRVIGKTIVDYIMQPFA